MENKENKKKAIFISGDTYKKLECLYKEFLEAKNKFSESFISQYGSTFDTFIEHILSSYCETGAKLKHYQLKFGEMLNNGDLKIDKILNMFSNNFFDSNNDDNKNENEKEKSKIDESKIRN